MILISVVFYNCKHEPNTIELIADSTSGSTGNTTSGNVIDSICYDDQIAPILNSSCAKSGCHNDTTHAMGINLSSYDKVISTVSPKLLIQAINDGIAGTPIVGMPQPPYPALSTAQRDLIQTWINQGMKNGIDCIGPCDTINVTYSSTVLPILQNACLNCHSGVYTPFLASYDSVAFYANNSKLDCVIKWQSGCSPMPKGGSQLSACKIKQIEIWIKAGAPNN